MEKNCVVTGGAGFIGSHLVGELLNRKYDVTVIDNFSTGKKENLEQYKNNKNLKIIEKDMQDEDIIEILKNKKIVFHVAAVPRVQYSIKFPIETNRVNINGTLNMLQKSKEAGVERFIYSASSSAYGNQDSLPLVETMKPNPMSPYALQKLVGEYYCRLYYQLYSLQTIALRYFNVYGPGQDPAGGYASLIPKTIKRVLNGESPEIYGDGEQTRDFTFVKDIVKANILAAETENNKAFGEVFNIGNGNNLSVNYVVEKIIGNRDIKPINKPPVIEPKNTRADNSKAREILNWIPEYNFDKGIEQTINWYIDNPL